MGPIGIWRPGWGVPGAAVPELGARLTYSMHLARESFVCGDPLPLEVERRIADRAMKCLRAATLVS